MVHAVAALTLSLILLGISPSLKIGQTITVLVGYVLYIPEYPVMILRNVALDMSNWFVGREELNLKIETLLNELETLRMQNSALSAQKTREMITPAKTNADVILRAPEAWWSEIRINKGETSGLSVGSPIYSNGFLLGRVSSVENYFAWVELLTSSSLMLPVVVEETRDLGIIGGDGEGNVWLHYVPENRGIKEGMTISTALIGDKVPPGLRIGHVSNESIVSPNGFRSLKVAIGADIFRLYSVSFGNTNEAGK